MNLPRVHFNLAAEIAKATEAYVAPKCVLCDEIEYLFALCYKHHRERGEYISRNHAEEAC